MTKPFFEKLMTQLVSDFGETEYTPMRVNLIWEHCKDLPDYNFGRIIRHFLETRSVKYPPLPTHFHEAALEQRKMLNQQVFGNRFYYDSNQNWSTTPIKEIMKKLGGETALEALEKQIEKNKQGEM